MQSNIEQTNAIAWLFGECVGQAIIAVLLTCIPYLIAKARKKPMSEMQLMATFLAAFGICIILAIVENTVGK